MNTYQEKNFPTNSKILNELRQVHQQLIRNDIDPRILSLMKTAIFREKIARDKLIGQKNKKMEMYNGMRGIWTNPTKGNKIIPVKEHSNSDAEKDLPKSNESELMEEEIQIDVEGDEDEEEEKMEDEDETELEIEVEQFVATGNENKISTSKNPQFELPKHIGEWQKLYEEELAKKYGNNHRIRYLFCRKLHTCYLEKLRQINRMPAEILTVNEKRFMKKFDMKDDLLVDRNNQKPYICYEDFFTVIYNAHIRSKTGKMREIFNKLKCKYANITLFSIQIYFKVRFQMMKRESYAKCIKLIYNC